MIFEIEKESRQVKNVVQNSRFHITKYNKNLRQLLLLEFEVMT